jgi:5-methyltetrahydropteroyltriglutamate--homocysteine methyltransferase
MGLVDGRNIWKIDLQRSLEKVRHFQEIAPNSKLIISPSCSLLHVPLDAELETDIDPELKSWLAFAEQKLEEIKTIGKYFDSPELVDEVIKENQDVLQSRESARKSSQDDETESEDIGQFFRTSSYSERVIKQRKALHLPDLPTTTIGSFPQTKEVRRMRFKFNRGEISRNDYEDFIKKETENTIRMQESLGLDVLVHGEFERNDMVQYFAEKLDGFSFTQNGWVQSYGSRCVRPPIIYKKVGRPKPMTVRWIQFAQSLTDKPMKGMLTGPVTILQWSFVRDDQPRETTCREIAFAIREEVLDLEAAGIRIIQIDEPAFREGMPVNQKDHANYLRWAVECFRIASGGVKDETQIHTHMCYSEFNQIIESIAAMDADVISIEASRSKMELLDAFNLFKYPNEIGPGVYDIHSPGVPISEDIAGLIRKALKVIPVEKIWVNPDCGLKTRRWEEALPSLKAMVSGARIVRSEISG